MYERFAGDNLFGEDILVFFGATAELAIRDKPGKDNDRTR